MHSGRGDRKTGKYAKDDPTKYARFFVTATRDHLILTLFARARGTDGVSSGAEFFFFFSFLFFSFGPPRDHRKDSGTTTRIPLATDSTQQQDIRRRRRFFVSQFYSHSVSFSISLSLSLSLSCLLFSLCSIRFCVSSFLSVHRRSSPFWILFFPSLPVIPGKASGRQLLCATKLHFSTQSQA